MDHFLLPKGKGHIRVPNLTSKDYTSGVGDFHDYPAREGWTSDDVDGRNSFGGRSPTEVQAFFQNWLYFGCAIEVLRVSGVTIRQEDLLDADQKYVSTRRLPAFIRQWRKNIKAIGDKNHPQFISWAMEVALILKKVSNFVDIYCSASGNMTQPSTSGPRRIGNMVLPLPEKVWVTVIALGHTFTEALLRYHNIVCTGNKWGASLFLKRRMLQKGWCPSDVERSLTDIGIDGHYFMAKSANTETNLNHGLCTIDQCVARNINEAKYTQNHAPECSGRCAAIAIDEASLAGIIDNNEIPVVSWNAEEKILDVEPTYVLKRGVSDPAYLCLSHVWSDGLGNPTENSLHECQLSRIQNLVKAAAAEHNLRGNPYYFWLDTLCVPVRDTAEMKERRIRCIRRMASIYKGAAAVLVLSSGVLQVSTTDSEQEQHFALFTSNWNRRLWTFQEGMLAERLLLQFADKSLDHDRVSYREVSKSVNRGHCVTFPKAAANSTMAEFVILRDFLRERLFEMSGPLGQRMGTLSLAVNAIQIRSTSKRSDETICLGTLFRLRIERLQAVEQQILADYRSRGIHLVKIPDHELGERRMEVFLSMIKVFPADIIFNSHSRLLREDFRWAPSSLLGIPRKGFVRHVEGYGIFDRNRGGLSVSAPGFIIRTPKDSKNPKPFAGSLLVNLRRDHGNMLEAQIRPSRPASGVEHRWMPGTCYGIVLRRSLEQESQLFTTAKTIDSVPKNGPELEIWFENLYPRIDTHAGEVDVVIGTIRHEHREDCSVSKSLTLRHECIGVLHVLKSRIPEAGPDLSGPEIPIPDGRVSEGDALDAKSDLSWLSTDEDEDDEDEEEDDSENLPDLHQLLGQDKPDEFDLDEDYETGSERYEPSPLPGDTPESSSSADSGDDVSIASDVELEHMEDSGSEFDDGDLQPQELDGKPAEEDLPVSTVAISGTLKLAETKWLIM